MKSYFTIFLTVIFISGYSQEFCGFKLKHKARSISCGQKFEFAGKEVMCNVSRLKDGLIYTINIYKSVRDDSDFRKEMKFLKKFIEKNYDIKLKKNRFKNKTNSELNFTYDGENISYKLMIACGVMMNFNEQDGHTPYEKNKYSIVITIEDKELSPVASYEMWQVSPEYLKLINEKELPDLKLLKN